MAATSLHDPDLARAMARLAAAGESLGRADRWVARSCPRDVGDHLHHIPTVVVCLAGAVRIEGGPQGSHDLLAGEALAIPPATRHRHAPLRAKAQYIDIGAVSDVTDFEVRGDGVRVWGRAPLQPYHGWCERLTRSSSADDRRELGRRLCRGLAAERLATMSYPNPALDRMTAALWPMTPGLTTRRILAASGLGPSQAHAVFKAFFRASPKQMILQLRLGMARHLLDEGASVAEAAEQAGFARRADLTRAWRARHGSAPSTVRPS